MKELVLVFLGGGLGSVARYLVGRAYALWSIPFPLATLTANFLSCVVFGAVLILASDKLNLNSAVKLLMISGFCGGFSTYSSFTYETIELFKNGSQVLAIANILLNFILSVSGLYLGLVLARFL
jgi:fluoride exporter